MSIQIRLGLEKDIDVVAKLYDDTNDYLEKTVNYPGWSKGIYPVRSDAAQGIEEGTLFIADDDGKTAGSMILRHIPEPAYLSAPWQAALDYANVLVIYTFVVNPLYQKCGIGEKLLLFAEEYAKGMDVRALRLDVYEENIPAVKLYEKCGYQYIDTVSLGLESCGLNHFRLYEKLLRPL